MRDLGWIAILLLAALAGLVLLPHAFAENVTINQSYVVVEYPNSTGEEYPVSNVTRRIQQGECVVPGETLDIAGLGWYTGSIVYFGRWYDGYSTDYNRSAIAYYSVKSNELKRFVLNPDFFSNHYGYWYVNYNDGSHSGNDRLFYVAEMCVKTPQENATIIQEAINETTILAGIIANKTTLPVKGEANTYIIAKSYETSLGSPDNAHGWLFGRTADDSWYDRKPVWNNITTFDAKETANMEAGIYTLVFVKPGRNGIIEETYDPKSKTISSPFRSQADTNIFGIQPQLVKNLLLSRIASSYDDSYESWRVDLQDPSIEVMRLDSMALRNNHTMFIIKGYTNGNPGDTLTIRMDMDANKYTNPKNIWQATSVNNGGIGAYRAWNTSFIVNMNGMSPGQHHFTVSNTHGAMVNVPFYVYRELPKHYVQDAYVQYIGNSPFVPPVTVTVPVPGPTRIVTVTIPVTPAPEVVYAQQKKAQEDVIHETLYTAIVCTMAIIALLLGGLYLNSIRRRL